MNILVYGAGVIGSVYAARLSEAGHSVTLLARGQREVAVRKHGIVLEDAQSGQQTATSVSVVNTLFPDDAYDIIIVAVRLDQVASVLPALVANKQTPTVLFLVNNPLGIEQLMQALGQRVLLGFPGVGGTRRTEGMRYLLLRQQPTTIGEVDGRITARLQEIAAMLKAAGFPVAMSRMMEAWLKTHAVFVSCIAAAIIRADGDSVRLSRRRKDVVMLVKAIREGFTALQTLHMPIAPFNLKVIFTWMPVWFAVLYWQYALRTTIGTLAMAPHANAARDEMSLLAQEVLKLIHSSSYPTPTLDRLLSVLASPVPPKASSS
jgi:2-dehydropantoate 2-reductase